jgi:DNA polymerase-1
MTLLIDADWLVYTACSACECDIRWDEWINTLHLEQSDVKDFVTSKLGYWQDLTGHSAVVLCFSDYPTFRHDLHQEYKANRIGKRKPLGLRDIRLWIEQNYEVRTCIGLEGDDVLGLLATGGQYRDPIIVSIDKDMRTIPCQLLANDQVETIHRVDADRAWMIQTLTGDSTDNYQGIKGHGPVTANKTLDTAVTLPELWDKVLAAYKKAGLTYGDALRNARLARILRHGDYDFGSGEIRLWDPGVDPAMQQP